MCMCEREGVTEIRVFRTYYSYSVNKERKRYSI